MSSVHSSSSSGLQSYVQPAYQQGLDESQNQGLDQSSNAEAIQNQPEIVSQQYPQSQPGGFIQPQYSQPQALPAGVPQTYQQNLSSGPVQSYQQGPINRFMPSQEQYQQPQPGYIQHPYNQGLDQSRNTQDGCTQRRCLKAIARSVLGFFGCGGACFATGAVFSCIFPTFPPAMPLYFTGVGAVSGCCLGCPTETCSRGPFIVGKVVHVAAKCCCCCLADEP